MNTNDVFWVTLFLIAVLTSLVWREIIKEGIRVLTGETDGYGNERNALGSFKKLDGSVETVYTIGRFNLLTKVPDVELVEDFRTDSNSKG